MIADAEAKEELALGQSLKKSKSTKKSGKTGSKQKNKDKEDQDKKKTGRIQKKTRRRRTEKTGCDKPANANTAACKQEKAKLVAYKKEEETKRLRAANRLSAEAIKYKTQPPTPSPKGPMRPAELVEYVVNVDVMSNNSASVVGVVLNNQVCLVITQEAPSLCISISCSISFIVFAFSSDSLNPSGSPCIHVLSIQTEAYYSLGRYL